MNSSRRVENAQKAAVPLSSYEFDFGLGSAFSSHQSSKSLKDQKHHHPPAQPSPAPAWAPNKPSWTPQPSPSPMSRPGQAAGLSGGWSGQSGFTSGWSGQSQPASMVGDIFGKSWAKSDSSKLGTSGIVGGPNAGGAHLFGDLVGEVLGQQKSNIPLKQAPPSASFSMGSVAAALPKGGTPLKDSHKLGQSVEEFGDFADQHSSKKQGDPGSDPFPAFPSFAGTNVCSPQEDPFGSFADSTAKEAPLQSGSTVIQDPFVSPNNEEKFGDFQSVSATTISADNQSGDPFVSANNEDIFGEFQKESTNHASSGSGDPFAASLNVPDDLFGGTSIPNSSNAGDPFADFTFGGTGGGSGGIGFADPLTSFSSSSVKQGTAPGGATDPFEMLNKSFSSQKPGLQEKGKDPLDSLFSSTSASTLGGVASQTFSETDDWGLDTGFGGDDGGTTTELEGLPPPPAGVTLSIAKDKGMENYKQGQFADAIKWFSWAMVLLEKGDSGGDAALEILTCRASCYKEVGEYKKAVSDCSQVLDHDNSNASVLLQRALLYESTEKYKLGVEDLRKVLKIDPGNRLAKSTLSRLVKMAD